MTSPSPPANHASPYSESEAKFRIIESATNKEFVLEGHSEWRTEDVIAELNRLTGVPSTRITLSSGKGKLHSGELLQSTGAAELFATYDLNGGCCDLTCCVCSAAKDATCCSACLCHEVTCCGQKCCCFGCIALLCCCS